MTEWLRRAGRGRDAGGAIVTWSVAEGRRGRRWREVRVAEDGVLSSLLLELDPDGRFLHTELSTASGLLTLHPEGDGTLHGNTVTASGVGHVNGLAWAEEGVVLLEGSPVAAAAAAAYARGPHVGTPGHPPVVLRIGLDLSLRLDRAEAVQLAGAANEEGLPLLAEAADWPLEEPPEG